MALMERSIAVIAAMLAGAALAGPVYTQNSIPYLTATSIGSKLIGALCAPDALTCGLWVTDGTAAGTREVMPPAGRVFPRWGMVSSGGIAYFIGRQATWEGPYNDDLVWRSDGSGSGTFPVLAAPRAKGFVVPAAAGGSLIYLSESDGVWRTDGTAGGTLKLSTSTTSSVTGVGGLVYFQGSDGQLWRSDGTSNGTLAVASAGPDKSAGSVPYYYLAPDASTVMQLWATDGTAAGTRALVPMSYPALPVQAATYAVIFQPFSDSTRLWRTDGTASGTTLMGDFQFTITAPDPTTRAAVADKVYFNCYPTSGAASKLCSTDGTAAGTGPVAPVLNVNVANVFTVAGGVLYGASGGGVFRTQGTDATSIYLPDSYYPWAALGNQMLYALNSRELWITDGTLAGSRPVAAATGPTPTFAFTSASGSVAENGATALTVTRSGSEGTVSVHWSTGNATAIAGQDFGTAGNPSQRGGVLTWADGDASTRQISIGALDAGIPIIDNETAQASARAFTVTLSNATPGSDLGAIRSATVNIVDNEPADDRFLSFRSATYVVNEGGSVTATVTRTGNTSGEASATVYLETQTASWEDIGVGSNPTLYWAPGDASPKQVTVTIKQDQVIEGDETFRLYLWLPMGAQVGAIGSAIVTIRDDDRGFEFESSSYAVSEGEGTVTLRVLRLGPAGARASVQWATTPLSAVAGQDYGTAGSSAQRSGTLSWAANDASPKSIVIPILDDSVSEGNEFFSVSLSTPSAGMLIAGSGATVGILDNDIPPESGVQFVGGTKVAALEGGSDTTITVRRNPLAGSFTVPLTVKWATIAGTALGGSDFIGASGTLDWGPSDTGDRTFTLHLVDNNVAEPHKTFRVALTTTSPGATVLTPEITVVVVDDDELFPPQGAVPAAYVTPAAATRGWHVSNDAGAYEGAFSLRADQIEDGQSAQIEVTKTFTTGTITFRVKVSSEPSFDKLRFFVDDVEKGSWSGTSNTAWQLFSMPITAGGHTIRWSYEKDSSASLGYDSAWIDAVTLP